MESASGFAGLLNGLRDDEVGQLTDDESELSESDDSQQDTSTQVASSSSLSSRTVMQPEQSDVPEQIRKRKRKAPKECTHVVHSQEVVSTSDLVMPQVSNSEIVTQPEISGVTNCIQKAKRKVVKRKPWTECEKEAVRSHFASEIMSKMLPGKRDIEVFLQQSHLNREWRNVKDHVRNTYLN
jgi:hypothetical protein